MVTVVTPKRLPAAGGPKHSKTVAMETSSERCKEVDRRFHAMVANFHGRRTRTISWRREQVEGIQEMVRSEMPLMRLALLKDLERIPGKLLINRDIDAELVLSKCSCNNLDDEAPHAQMVLLVASHPLMPFAGILVSLIPLLRNGCCVYICVSGSELMPACAQAMESLISKYLDSSGTLTVCDGQSLQHLLNKKFDRIFFTGGSQMLQKVQAAANAMGTPIAVLHDVTAPETASASDRDTFDLEAFYEYVTSRTHYVGPTLRPSGVSPFAFSFANL